MTTLGDYLLVSGILFSIGFAGVMVRRNLIIILMSLELMLNAANLSLVAFSRFRIGPDGLPNYNAQIFVFLDRKSTRLNSSHITISYAVFCLKKKKFIKFKLII